MEQEPHPHILAEEPSFRVSTRANLLVPEFQVRTMIIRSASGGNGDPNSGPRRAAVGVEVVCQSLTVSTTLKSEEHVRQPRKTWKADGLEGVATER